MTSSRLGPWVVAAFVLGVVGVSPTTVRGQSDPAVQLPIADAILIEIKGGCGAWYGPGHDYETGFAWQYLGIGKDLSGSFAVQYEAEGRGQVCTVSLDVAQIGNQHGQRVDLYVWDSADGVPSAVLGVAADVDIGTTAIWPEAGRHRVGLEACVDGEFWVGFQGRWVGEEAPYFVAADLDGPARPSMTKVAPGLGYPSGWQDVSVVWQAATLGIGLELRDCPVDPTVEASWGDLKRQFRGAPAR